MAPVRFCTYCHVERATDREHVFPASWYPDTTPSTVQRLTVPSCRACNSRWQQVEETVGHDLLMVCDDSHPDVAGVLERITKGWDSSRAKNERDAEYRERRALGIFKTLRWERAHEQAPQVPFQMPDGSIVQMSPAREIDRAALNALAEKFIRGLHYAEGKGDIPLTHVVKALVVPSPGVKMASQRAPDVFPKSVARVMNNLPINEQLRPGFLYRWVGVGADSMWTFRLWGHLTVLAVCNVPLVVPAR